MKRLLIWLKSIVLMSAITFLWMLLLTSCGGGGGGGGGGGEDPTLGQGMDIILNPNDELMLTSMDDSNVFYSFFCVKDAEGACQYFNELVLHLVDEDNEFAEHFLTIEFDDKQRPIKAILPNFDGEISLNYISATEVEVTIHNNDGTTETVVVPNPYEDVHHTAHYRDGDASYPEVFSTSGLNKIYRFDGFIDVCDESKKPHVIIKREHAWNPKYPALLIFPKIKEYGVDEFDFSYTYSFTSPNPIFEEWEADCNRLAVRTVSLLLGGAVLGGKVALAATADGLYSSICEDLKEKSLRNTSLTIINTLLDKLGEKKLYGIPVGSYIGLLGQALESGHGPCTYETWDYKSKIQLKEQQLYCAYNDDLKQDVFKPDPYKFRQEAPSFKFEDCCSAIYDCIITHTPVDPTLGQTVTVTVQTIPKAAGCPLKFNVLFKKFSKPDYIVTKNTDGDGKATIQVTSPAVSDTAAVLVSSSIGQIGKTNWKW